VIGKIHRVQIFDNDGYFLATIGSGFVNEDYQIKWPEYITIDEFDRLYIPVRQRVDVFDVSAAPIIINFLGSIDFIEMDGDPAGVAVDLPNNRIYVADSKNIKVHIFNSDDWSYVGYIDLETTPTDVAVDLWGNLYIAQSDPTVSQVLKYNSDLSFQDNYGTKGIPYLTDNYHLLSPSGWQLVTIIVYTSPKVRVSA
jgi:DNA-binding beta-propeller fold protein YncE